MRDAESVREAVEFAVDTWGGLDAAVSAAGVIAGGMPLWEMPAEQERAVLDICLGGVSNLARAAIPALLARHRDHHPHRKCPPLSRIRRRPTRATSRGPGARPRRGRVGTGLPRRPRQRRRHRQRDRRGRRAERPAARHDRRVRVRHRRFGADHGAVGSPVEFIAAGVVGWFDL
ncbi:SDR family oxidoreductase [Nocardia higoensis]|uniref:SDR family oxidoreductase n=1 Tax=Nocardia higoensis TaxID=228599 RepID=UPI003A5CFD74